MDELILKSYLDKIKEEYKFINLFKQSDILNKCMIILYFLLASLFVIMIILGCFIKGLLAYACIPLFLLVVPASIMIISTRKERTTNNQIKILIEDIENVKSILIQFDIDIKNTNQIEKLHIRLNNRLNEFKAKTEKKRNNIFKVFQISIIPIFLAVFNQFIENSFDIDTILSFCLIYIFMIAVFAFVIYAISETYFDMTSKYYRNMEKFLSLLKDIEEYDTETLNKISALSC